MSQTAACLGLALSCHGARGGLQPAAGSGCSLHCPTSSSSRSRVSPVFANFHGTKFMHVLGIYLGKRLTHRQIVLILIDRRTQLLLKQKTKRRNVWYVKQAVTSSVSCTGQNVHSPAVRTIWAELLHKIQPMSKAALATSEGQSRSATFHEAVCEVLSKCAGVTTQPHGFGGCCWFHPVTICSQSNRCLTNVPVQGLALPLASTTVTLLSISDGSYVSVPSPLGKIKNMTKGIFNGEGKLRLFTRGVCQPKLPSPDPLLLEFSLFRNVMMCVGSSCISPG